MDEFTTEELNEINKAQKLEGLRIWNLMKGSEHRKKLEDDTPEPLTEEVFHQWFGEFVSLPPRKGPPYVTGGIGEHIIRPGLGEINEEIKPFPMPDLPPWLGGIKKRRLRI